MTALTTKAKRAVKPGHLKDGELYLPDSAEKRQRLSDAARSHHAIKTLKAPELDWKQK